MFTEIIGIDLFDKNVDVACLRLESNVNGYHWYCFI